MRAEWDSSDVRIHPAGPVRGAIRPPGSKSLTNRYLTCAALADGISVLRGASPSDDTAHMVAGLRELGVTVEVIPETQRMNVRGVGGHLPATRASLDLGGAGTAMRFLTAVATLGRGIYRLDGSQRMRQRPIGPLVAALQDLGANVTYEHMVGYPPLMVAGGGLTGGHVQIMATESSQFLSAVLMAAPYAAGDVFVNVGGKMPSQPYVEMTIEVMRSMGAEVLSAEGRRFVVAAGQRYHGGQHEIEADASAATYFWAAAAVTGGVARVLGLSSDSRQGDVQFADVLEQMGCEARTGADFVEVRGPPPGQLRGVSVDLNQMPDTVQTLAVTALFANSPTHIRNVANLRVKETDRLSALAAELARLSAKVELTADSIAIYPPSAVSPAAIDTYDDHRMAMAFSIAGLVVDGILIRDADCVSKSYPDFFAAVNQLQ